MRPIFVLLLAFLGAGTAQASGTLGIGIVDAHDGESSTVLELSLRWPTSGRYRFIDEHEVLAGYIDARPLPLLDRDARYLGYGVRTRFGRWYTGFGVVAVDNTSEALSSWYQFVSTGGVHLGRASLTLRHISNSGFRGRNRGETFLSLGYDW